MLNTKDKDLRKYLLLCFTNLSVVPVLKKPLLSDQVLDFLIKVCGDDRFPEEVILGHKILYNLAVIREVKGWFFC